MIIQKHISIRKLEDNGINMHLKQIKNLKDIFLLDKNWQNWAFGPPD